MCVTFEIEKPKHGVKAISRVFVKLTQATFQLLPTCFPWFDSVRFENVHNQLWCVERNTSNVMVCDTDGNHLKVLNYPEMDYIRSLTKNKNCVVFSSKKGLFVSRDKQTVEKIYGGNFTDVCCYESILSGNGYPVSEILVSALLVPH